MEQLRLFNEPQREYTSDDYWTPKWVFDALGLEFDLDVACPPEGPAHTPCKRFYTQADDGLTAPWEGCVWMNPPYSKPLPWVEKWINHANGMALLPTNGGRWCNLLWQSNAQSVWLGRLAFDRKHDHKSNSPLNIMLWGIGQTAINALLNANMGKLR